MSVNAIGKSSSRRRSFIRDRKQRLGTVRGPQRHVSGAANDGVQISSQLLASETEVAPNQDDATPTSAGSPSAPIGGKLKRAADIAIALCALAVASPIMLIVAVILKLSDGGAAIFSHNRIGFGGASFRCYKFRTMVANSGEVLTQHLASNAEAAVEWEETQKLRDDPRITAFGRLLRKSSIDELPQLFNVLKGEMSCIGPRPIVAEELSRYGPNAADYLSARPGLTGLWQVTGRSRTDYPSRVALDSKYVNNWSLWADAVILVRTIFAVMRFDEAS
ncbi:exopolysaccharide production protein ExoY [Mesorhizobium soli]|jgi:exopolysaccharide production protein ExoY|uniref:sugar transferase n=1 Tax=Pseudaminobacter soli (ex Li et al. 2025) TaxID=1295366 RepID=UPI00247589C5|nr:sugar transferase [Mesorhizobium soli]MDH6229824.1 exopolysaccharide production protein ExoY [Mesorhizobium soli]